MKKKEFRELKKQYQLTDCSISRVCGCFISLKGEKITTFNDNFLNLPEEDMHKYFEILKKGMSGTDGKNRLNLTFNKKLDAQLNGKTSLNALVKSGLKDEKILNSFYDSIIEHYHATSNYIVLLFSQDYDVPFKGSDGSGGLDSENVYSYIYVCICPVNALAAGLTYDEDNNKFTDKKPFLIIDKPENAFIYPNFVESSSDYDSVYYYIKSSKYVQHEFMENVLNVSLDMDSDMEKNTFNELVKKSLDKKCSFDVVTSIFKEIDTIIDNSETPDIKLEKNRIMDIFEDCGVTGSELSSCSNNFDELFGENAALTGGNITESSGTKVTVGNNVTVKLKNKGNPVIKRTNVNGKDCIIIELAPGEHVDVNGIELS